MLMDQGVDITLSQQVVCVTVCGTCNTHVTLGIKILFSYMGVITVVVVVVVVMVVISTFTKSDL